jgi:imidazolonepropionase-like amidohydrolase
VAAVRGEGVISIDHANHLEAETVRLMREMQIFVVATLTIFEYFVDHPVTPADGAQDRKQFQLKVEEFPKQVAALPMAVGSDVGSFPHGTQAREFELMVKYGMSPLAVYKLIC